MTADTSVSTANNRRFRTRRLAAFHVMTVWHQSHVSLAWVREESRYGRQRELEQMRIGLVSSRPSVGPFRTTASTWVLILLAMSVVWYHSTDLVARGELTAQRRLEVVAPSSSAERRVALVIGNGDYTRTGALANPVNDASDMAAALRGLGFDVVSRLDADEDEMDDALAWKIRDGV